MITYEQVAMLQEVLENCYDLRVLCGMQVFENVRLVELKVPMPLSTAPEIRVVCTFGGVRVVADTAPIMAGVDALVLPRFEHRESFTFSVVASRCEELDMGRFKLITEMRELYTPPDRLLYSTDAKPLAPVEVQPWAWFRAVETFVEVLT